MVTWEREPMGIDSIQTFEMNQSTLYGQAYAPNSSSLDISGGSVVQVEVVQSLERPVLKPFPSSLDRSLVR
jgi:hypothetical protein